MRHVPWKKLLRDEHDKVIGFLPQAFERRPQEEALSVNWLEHFGANKQKNIELCVLDLRKARRVGKADAFGIANVGVLKQVCSENGGVKIRVSYTPNGGNPSHTGVFHLPNDDLALLDAVAADAFVEMVKNKDL